MPAYSFVQYTGDGSTGPFVIPFPYLDRTHLRVQVDAVEASFSFDSGSAISLTAPAPAGSVIEIRRSTPAADRLVDFTDGSVLTEVDLDTALLQQMYLAQETFDLSATAITLGSDGVFDFMSRRAVSLADPTGDQDAATKAYVDGTTATSAAAAAASATAAAASASSASSQATAATSAASAAAAAQSAAETAETDAQTAQAGAEAAAASINGVPSGGALGQVLTKQSGTDYDVAFQDAAGGVEIVEVAGAPDADDDDSDTGGNGTFSLGSQWRDTTTDVLYVCVDASTGAAVWHAFNVQSGLIGEVVAWPAAAIPSGWLECNGAAVSRTTYDALFAAIGTTFGSGDGSTTFNLPDLRGEFIRGFDNGRGVDSGRVFGASQAESFEDHAHLKMHESGNTWGQVASGEGSTRYSGTTAGSYDDAYTSGAWDSSAGTAHAHAGTETRPRNVALKYIIRAASTYDVADLTPNMPNASTAAAGAARKATQVEVDAGTEADAFVTPQTLAGAAGRGSLVYIGVLEASNDAALDFTDLGGGYVAYYFQFDEVVVATDDVHFHMRTSADNGVTFDSGASDYKYGAVGQYGGGTSPSYVASNAADFFRISDNQGSGASEGMSGELWLYNPSRVARTRINWRICADYYTGAPHYLAGAGTRVADEAVDAVRFFAASGNIESGKIRLWGLRA